MHKWSLLPSAFGMSRASENRRALPAARGSSRAGKGEAGSAAADRSPPVDQVSWALVSLCFGIKGCFMGPSLSCHR